MANPHDKGWTPDRVQTLKKLWQDGLSINRIAVMLGGGVTRNGVIGKVHRMGLSGRSTPVRTRQPRQRDREPKLPLRPTKILRRAPIKFGRGAEFSPVATPPTAVVAPVLAWNVQPALRVDLLDLRDCMCRWPIGDPKDESFHFCGRDKAARISYCEGHARVAFRPSTGAVR